MPRVRNPLSKRNRNATFTGAEVRQLFEQLAASKKARVVRERGEFDLRALTTLLRPPPIPQAAYAWSIDQIVAARDAQMIGNFRQAARLAESMNTDDALFTARGVRLAPIQSLSVKMTAGRGPKADKIADEADALFGNRGIAVSSETVSTIRRHLTDHGIAFASVGWTPRADGSRWDPMLTAWPIEFVKWDSMRGCYVSQVDPSSASVLDMQMNDEGVWVPSHWSGDPTLEPIVHGNGRWVIFSKEELLPHRADAALLPAALVWARHAFAMRDWSKGSASHGNPKVLGELPADTPLRDAEGALTEEAAMFLEMLQAVASQDSPVGIQPSGSKVNYLTNTSAAWEVWVKLAETAERAAARIYLGTDGVLGAQGGAPGVDISQLFGVATSKVQSDLRCIERGLQTGLISPWAAINFGDDKLAPVREYVFPDPDESRVREDFAKRNAAFNADVSAYRQNGFLVDQALVDRLAELHGVPAPLLAAPPAASTPALRALHGHLVARMPPLTRARGTTT